MKVRALVLNCVSLVLLGVGCGRPTPLTTNELDSDDKITKSAPRLMLSDADILARFRSRASQEEQQDFDGLVAATDEESRIQALEHVLFKLSTEELFAIGVTASEQSGHISWCVAWSRDTNEEAYAIRSALGSVGVGAFGSCRHGHAGWYVPRQQFFSARRALIDSASVRLLDINVVAPKLKLR